MFLLSNYKKEPSIRPDDSDASIIAQYKRTNNTALIGLLFERYTHLVYGVCLKYLKHEEDSKDAVMQIFEDLINKLKIHEIENFKSWLYSVTKNHCLMKLRSNKKEVPLFEDTAEKRPNLVMEFEEELHLLSENNSENKYDVLHEVIRQLKEEQSRCITLMYIENKSYKEISEITGYGLKKVKSYIQNGKRNLKLILSSYNNGQ